MNNNNNMINERTIENMFDFKNADKDVCSIIAMFIGGDKEEKKKLDKIDYNNDFYYMIDKIVECEYCNHKDMANDNNFKSICCGCSIVCCMKCYNEERYEIANEDEDICDWLCYDCSADCEGCDQIVYNENMRGLMDKSGDYKYRCCNCLNNKSEITDIVFEFDNENYDKKDCSMGDNDKIECKKCEQLDTDDNCIAGYCDDEECSGWERCGDCKNCYCAECNEEHYEGAKKDEFDNEYECEECVAKYNNVLHCEGCNNDYSKISREMFKLGDKDKYVCDDCINDNMMYM